LNRSIASMRLARGCVQLEISEPKVSWLRGLVPTKQCPYPRNKNLERARLDNVVVCAAGEAFDLVGRGIARRQDDDG
jgi:hypothetical protein